MVARNTLIFVILLFFAGCKNNISTNAPRILNARFLNQKFTIQEPINVDATVSSREPATISYRWFVNNTPIANLNGNSLSTTYFHKNDKIVCEVSAKDTLGRESKTYKLGPVKVANSPPKITWADITPTDSIYKGVNLSVTAQTEDADGDEVKIRYNWYVDNKLVSKDSILDGNLLVAGKNVKLTLIPFDGDTTGERFDITRPVLVQNLPPNIIGTPAPVIKGKLVTCKVNAQDPDGDKISYEIEEGPNGMTIDSLGNINWNIPEPVKDTTYKVTVKVTDTKGAGKRIEIPLRIKKTPIQVKK